MKKFMVLYHAPVGAQEQMKNASPEDMKKGMEPWIVWQKKLGKNLVDMGTPLANGRRITKSGTDVSSRNVAGYSIIQAESMDEAVEMVKNHPHLMWMDGAEVEVHEFLPLPM